MNIKHSISSMKNIFSDVRYLFLALIFAFIFYMLNVIIFDVATLHSVSSSLGFFGSLKILFLLAFNFSGAIKFYSFVSVVIMSFLFGIFISLLAYKTSLNLSQDQKKISILGWFGVFLAFLIPGCAVCGIGVLSLLGIGAGTLSLLPAKGLEISIISVAILLFTVFRLSESMYACEITAFKNFKVNSKSKLKGGF